jgi:hypothetical protein
MHLNLGSRSVFRHGIDFQGEDSRFVRRKIIRQILMDNYGADLPKVESSILFDDNCIYSPSPLKVEQNVDLQVKVGTKTYTVKIMSMTQVKSADAQMLNIVFNKALSACDLQRIGRGYFEKKEKDLSAFPKTKDALQIFPGYHTEVLSKLVASQRTLMNLVNIDPISKVLCRDTVADVIYDIQGDEEGWTAPMRKEANKQLIGQIVYTRYNYQTYTIEGIDYARNAFTKFRARNRKTGKEEEMTYVEYYKQKGLVMKYPELVLIKTKGPNGSRIHLIPEFCLLTDITPEARRDLPKICSVKPPERMTRIKELPALLMSSPGSKKILDSFGVQVETSPVSVPSKTLNPPRLITPTKTFEYGGAFGADLGKDFAFNNKEPRVLHIIVTYDDDPSCKQLVEYYVKEIGAQLKDKKSPVLMGKREERAIAAKNNELHLPVLTKILTDLKITDNTSILYLSFLQNKRNNKQNYEGLKEYCINKGIIHQNIDASNNKHQTQGATVVSNIMKQIVNKFGHLCWWSPIHSIDPAFKNKTLMFIGIDVYHAKKTFEGGDDDKNVYRQRRSIGAFTSSIITPDGRYLTSSHVNPHNARRELISRADSDTSSVASGKSNKSQDDEEEEELAAKEVLGGIGYMKQDALKNFINKTMTKHNIKPDFIFVYRDGVAESQLNQVKQYEVKQVREACTTAALTYMVVQKRISTRFLVQTKDDKVGNPAPGTLVDEFNSTVHDDFYLISLKNNISTVKPVRYIVVEDDRKVSRRTLQQMTHNLCYLYPNWADAIKLPFPTQLAHKLAFLVGEIKVNNPDVHENLFKTYYYL